MVKIKNYSTALKKEVANVKIIGSPTYFCDTIFVHDWSDDSLGKIDEEVLFGDFMYCEPSWRAGFYKYNGKDKHRFEVFMRNLSLLARAYANAGKPAVIMCGKESIKYMEADMVVDGAIMVGDKKHSNALAYCYGYFPEADVLTNYDFIQEMLSKGKRTPFDPTAGYGELYDDFPNLIATDVRPECVDEIIRHRLELGLL